MTFPEPVISVAVEPKTQADVDKMGLAISKLVEEDPTLRVKTDEETGQTILSGMGELHLEIIVDRMRREFKVEINQGAPQVAYKEAFKNTIEHREVLKKQTGGRGKFADIVFEIGPADEEFLKEGKGNFQFVNGLFGGSIPKEFVPAIQKGFETAMTTGVLASYPMESMKVRVFDGSFHQVDSDAMSFELCAKQGYREAGRKAKPTLLEPIMKVDVYVPDANVGDHQTFVIKEIRLRRVDVEIRPEADTCPIRLADRATVDGFANAPHGRLEAKVFVHGEPYARSVGGGDDGDAILPGRRERLLNDGCNAAVDRGFSKHPVRVLPGDDVDGIEVRSP